MRMRLTAEPWKCPRIPWFVPGLDAVAISTLLAVSSMLFDSAQPFPKLPDIQAERRLSSLADVYTDMDHTGQLFHHGWPVAIERYGQLFSDFVEGHHVRATRGGYSGWNQRFFGRVSTVPLVLKVDRAAPVKNLLVVLHAVAGAGITEVEFPTYSGGHVSFRIPVTLRSPLDGPMDYLCTLEVSGQPDAPFRFAGRLGVKAEVLRRQLGSAVGQYDGFSVARLFIANDAQVTDVLRAVKMLTEVELLVLIMLDECEGLTVDGRRDGPARTSGR